MNNVSKQKKQEIPWIHFVRVLACIMVVCLHVCSSADSYSKESIDNVFLYSFYYATKPCVPLFFMVTGYLILPYRNGDNIIGFYKKRIPRVLFPLLVWGIIYACLPYFLGMDDLHTTFRELLLSPIKAPERIGGVLWYLFILIGIYLIIPFFSEKIYENKLFLKVYLVFWGGTTLIPILKDYYIHNQDILGQCHYIQNFDMFVCFSGYIGYVLIGYGIKKYYGFWEIFLSRWLNENGKLKYVILLLITIAACFVKPIFMEYFLTSGTAVITICLFLLLKDIQINTEGKIYRLIKHISAMSFGIYLCHMLVLKVFFEPLFTHYSASWYVMAICMIMTFVCAYVISVILSKLPFKRFIIG